MFGKQRGDIEKHISKYFNCYLRLVECLQLQFCFYFNNYVHAGKYVKCYTRRNAYLKQALENQNQK